MVTKRLVALQTHFRHVPYSFLVTLQSARIQSGTLLPFARLHTSTTSSDSNKGAVHLTRSARIAIVEDERELLSLYSNYLKEIGFDSIYEATSGEDLNRAITENAVSPDVLLIDYRLPGADGIETAKKIVARRPELRVIVTTADDSVRILADAEGFEFLLKPFSLATLARMLRSGSQSNR